MDLYRTAYWPVSSLYGNLNLGNLARHLLQLSAYGKDVGGDSCIAGVLLYPDKRMTTGAVVYGSSTLEKRSQ